MVARTSSPRLRDRRRAHRATARHPVLVDSVHAGRMCPAVVTDLSPRGLGLATDQPEPAGALLVVEWPTPDRARGTHLVHAEVVRCAPGTPSGWRVGVRLAAPCGALAAGGHQESCTAGDRPDDASVTLDAPVPRAPSPTPDDDAPPPAHRTEPQRRWPWAVLLLLLLLALVPLVMAPGIPWHGDGSRAMRGPGTRDAVDADTGAGPRLVLPAAVSPLEGVPAEALVLRVRPEHVPGPPVDPVDDALVAARMALARGDLAAADRHFAAVLADPSASAAQRRRARSGLGYAAPGDGGGATGPGTVGADTTEAAATPLGGLRGRTAALGQVRGGDPSTRAAAASGGASLPIHGDRPAPPMDAPVYLEVDRSRFEMTVYAFGRPIARYTVGLGVGDSTPTGDFVIANRLRNPVWHDRGRAVPPDDPEYPLGGYWMGLATAEGRIPYGFHGTNEPDSIGRAAGRGCIRLGPPDVEALFACVTVGTPVRIF